VRSEIVLLADADIHEGRDDGFEGRPDVAAKAISTATIGDFGGGCRAA
jgi:hypothetical protein